MRRPCGRNRVSRGSQVGTLVRVANTGAVEMSRAWLNSMLKTAVKFSKISLAESVING